MYKESASTPCGGAQLMMNMFQMAELLLLFYCLSVSLVLNDESSFFCINRYHVFYFCIKTLANEVDAGRRTLWLDIHIPLEVVLVKTSGLYSKVCVDSNDALSVSTLVFTSNSLLEC